MENFEPTIGQVGSLLNIGLRIVDVSKQENSPAGDAIAGFMLIPTKNGITWREIIKTEWEGSYIPFIVYRSGSAAILVPYGEEKWWQLNLADKLSLIFNLDVKALGD